MKTLKKIKNLRHYNIYTKGYIPIKDMSDSYLISVIRDTINSRKNSYQLVRDEEFQSLVIHLAKKIKRQIKEDEADNKS